jgi:hypothetical protein
MANRNFPNQFNSNLHAPVDICAKWAVGAVGAVGAIVGDFLHPVTPVVRNGAGDYTIQLADNYTNIYHVSAIVNTAVANEDLYCQVRAYNGAAAGGATIQILCKTGAVNTDPGNGDEIMVMIRLSNSGLNV